MISGPTGPEHTDTTLAERVEDQRWPSPARIAPPLHTIFFVLLLLAFSYFSAQSQHQFSHRHGRTALYAATIAWEWALVGYVALGVRKRIKLRELAGGRWRTIGDVAADIAIGIVFWMAASLVLGAIGYAIGLGRPEQAEQMRRTLGFLVPHSLTELGLFLAVSATAGFCEEIIFRGYFLRQFAAAARSAWAGVVLQALLFGASHAYEGRPRMALIAIYGVMFGALAIARRSLRPGMIAHALQDASAGTAMYFFLHSGR